MAELQLPQHVRPRHTENVRNMALTKTNKRQTRNAINMNIPPVHYHYPMKAYRGRGGNVPPIKLQ